MLSKLLDHQYLSTDLFIQVPSNIKAEVRAAPSCMKHMAMHSCNYGHVSSSDLKYAKGSVDSYRRLTLEIKKNVLIKMSPIIPARIFT